MIQTIKAKDKYKSSLFQWDSEKRILTIPHQKEIWYAELGGDGQFQVIGSKPKPDSKENRYKH
jgi:hypothetical protein